MPIPTSIMLCNKFVTIEHFFTFNINILVRCLVIENLPMEMREKLTEMREMDLQVQSKSFLRCNIKFQCFHWLHALTFNFKIFFIAS